MPVMISVQDFAFRRSLRLALQSTARNNEIKMSMNEYNNPNVFAFPQANTFGFYYD